MDFDINSIEAFIKYNQKRLEPLENDLQYLGYSPTPNAAILSQKDWFIDPNENKGKDTNDGKTPNTALRTFRELSRRWGKGNVLSPNGTNKTVTVHILGNLPLTDPLNFDVILDDKVDLRFVGYPTSSHFTVSAIRQRDRGSNLPCQLTTGGEIEVGQRINYTKYKDDDMEVVYRGYMWVLKDEGNNKFRISESLMMPATGFLLNGYRLDVNEHNGDFYVQTLTDVKTGSMRVGSVRTPITSLVRNSLVFQDLNITGDISPTLDMGTELYCYGCSIKGSIQLASGFARNFVNCCHNSIGQPIRITSGLTRFIGGAYMYNNVPGEKSLDGQGFLPTNCTTQFDFDVIFQGHSISIVAGNTLILGRVGIFDSIPGGNGKSNLRGNGIMVSGGSVTCRNLTEIPPTPQDSTHHLWGSGQRGYGVGVSSGGRFYFVSNPPTITGKAGTPNEDVNRNFILGGSSVFYEPKNDGTFEPAKDNKWSNLIIPQPAGTPPKFRNACNPISDSWILQTE